MEVALLFWLLLSPAPAILAHRKGHSAVFWFLLALLLSPLLALIFAAVMPDRMKAKEMADRYPCPHCKELIKQDASKCPHCRSDLEPITAGTLKNERAKPTAVKDAAREDLKEKLRRFREAHPPRE
jgi:hypothetical protein